LIISKIGYPYSSQYEDAFKAVFDKVWKQNVIVVSAGGQLKTPPVPGQPIPSVNDFLPPRLGSLGDDNSPLIVVGAIDDDGDIPGQAYVDVVNDRKIAVYATWEVDCSSKSFAGIVKTGTSVAAPAVAGVIATWLSIPQIKSVIETYGEVDGFWAAKVREFLRDISLTRNQDDSNINSLYNGFADNPCIYFDPADEAPSTRRVRRQARNPNDVPVVVNGTLVNPTIKPVGTRRAPMRLSAE
jgi:hypothetical protein